MYEEIKAEDVMYFLNIKRRIATGLCDEIILSMHKEFLKSINPGYWA